MQGRAGRFVTQDPGPASYLAFIPAALPPNPPVEMNGLMQDALEKAGLSLGRLDGITRLLPDPDLFLYMYIRKEAVLSSQIEGTQSSLSDLLLFENAATPGVPEADVKEVSNYIAAMNHGITALKTPLADEPASSEGSSRRAHGRHSRWRQDARRVPDVAELDRWQSSGERSLRAAPSSRDGHRPR